MGEDDRREDRILKNDPLMFVSKTSEVDVFEIGDVMEFWTDTALTRRRSRYGYGVVTSMLRFDTTSEMSFQCSQENVKYPGN